APALQLDGGNFTLLGQAAAVTSSAAFGTVTLAGGVNTITSTTGATGTNTISGTNLVRTTKTGTVIFVDPNNDFGSANNLVTFTQINGGTPTAALSSQILPFALVGTSATNPTDFSSYGIGGGTVATNNGAPANTTGIVALDATQYTTTIGAGSNTTN